MLSLFCNNFRLIVITLVCIVNNLFFKAPIYNRVCLDSDRISPTETQPLHDYEAIQAQVYETAFTLWMKESFCERSKSN